MNNKENVAVKGELSSADLRALLGTLSADNGLIIHKLEIQEKSAGTYRVIALASKAKTNGPKRK